MSELPSEACVLHNKIFIALDREIAKGTPDYSRFECIAGSYLGSGETARCSSMLDLLKKMEIRGLLEVGDYKKLKDMLSQAGLVALREMVNKREVEIDKMLGKRGSEKERMSRRSPIMTLAKKGLADQPPEPPTPTKLLKTKGPAEPNLAAPVASSGANEPQTTEEMRGCESQGNSKIGDRKPVNVKSHKDDKSRRLLHHRFIVYLHNYHLPPKSDNFKTFKYLCRTHLTIASLDECKDIMDIVCALESQEVIGIEQYDNLKTLFRDVGLKNAVTAVEDHEREMGSLSRNDTAEGDSITENSANAGTDSAAAGSLLTGDGKFQMNYSIDMYGRIDLLDVCGRIDMLDHPELMTMIKKMARENGCSRFSIGRGSYILNMYMCSLETVLTLWLNYLNLVFVHEISDIFQHFEPDVHVFVKLDVTNRDLCAALNKLGDIFLMTPNMEAEVESIRQVLETIVETIAHGNLPAFLRECVQGLLNRMEDRLSNMRPQTESTLGIQHDTVTQLFERLGAEDDTASNTKLDSKKDASEEQKMQHYRLIVQLNKLLPPGSDDYQNFESSCRKMLPDGSLLGCHDAFDLFDVLAKHRLLEVGMYDTVRDLLMNISESISAVFEEYEEAVESTPHTYHQTVSSHTGEPKSQPHGDKNEFALPADEPMPIDISKVTVEKYPDSVKHVCDFFGGIYTYAESDTKILIPVAAVEDQDVVIAHTTITDVHHYRGEFGLLENQTFVSPIIELSCSHNISIFKKRVTVFLPICKEISANELQVYGYYDDKRVKIPLFDLNTEKDTCFAVEKQMIKIYTWHFSKYCACTCNPEKKHVDLMAYIYAATQDLTCNLRLYLCDQLHSMKDFKRDFDKQQKQIGFTCIYHQRVKLLEETRDEDCVKAEFHSSTWKLKTNYQNEQLTERSHDISVSELDICNQRGPVEVGTWSLERDKVQGDTNDTLCIVHIGSRSTDDTGPEFRKETHIDLQQRLVSNVGVTSDDLVKSTWWPLQSVYEHTKLMANIGRAIPVKHPSYIYLTQRVLCFINTEGVLGSKNFFDILKRLESKGCLSIGNYDVLKDIFSDDKDLLKMLEDGEKLVLHEVNNEESVTR